LNDIDTFLAGTKLYCT